MCGIAGTIYNRNYIEGIEVTPQEIVILLNEVKNSENTSSKLLDLTWKYKSNINFLRYAKDSKERILISEIILSVNKLANEIKEYIPEIDKSVSYEEYNRLVLDHQNLLDVSWFLSVEIQRWVESIEFLSNKPIKELSNEVIILYKDIIKVINAIDNRLELRGRDSFGISINLNSDMFSVRDVDEINKDGINESQHFYNNSDKNGSYCFTFKTCNSIGALGENALEIKKAIKINELFNSLIQSDKVQSSTIMAHTRWASVGKVNIDNAHPVEYIDKKNKFGLPKISSILNGDIYNYKEIISNAKKNKSFNIDTSRYTNDCVAIPAFLSEVQNINIHDFVEMSNSFSGSFIISVISSKEPEKIFILKKGIQGLYVGFSYDGAMFASDVYGLVETCRYFKSIDTDRAVVMSAAQNLSWNNLDLSVLDTKKLEEFSITDKDLKETNITTRDIDKKEYEHFLDKEIKDTSDIVSRTISNYIQPEKSVDIEKIDKAVAITNSQIPEYIFENLHNKEIKKIIITGMGTCYTAAVAISMYMRSRLKIFMPFILVEPHIATEGSAFYLQPNMQDTLVIVIAQSGTTVDTNVYVQKAKERGAMSLAIANKREGDVTYIVDGTLYIGDGRDIEIAVPSTKTYTAQVILGYILCLSLTTKIAKKIEHKKVLLNDLKNLRNTENVIKDSFTLLENKQRLHNLSLMGIKHNSWFILRDDTSNSVCADEIRIKYSENCYQSVSSLSLSEAKDLNIKESFLVVVTESNIQSNIEIIKNLIDLNNSIILIANNISLSEVDAKISKNKNFQIINMPFSEKYFTFLPTIIAGQMLSYFQAISLDKRKDYFINIKQALNSNKIKEKWMYFIDAIDKGYFNQGFSLSDFVKLNSYLDQHVNNPKNNKDAQLNINNHLDQLILSSRRTIDTIKHQAKTITVGAVREDDENHIGIEQKVLMKNTFVSTQKESSIINLINSTFKDDISRILEFNGGSHGEILIAFEDADESIAYNISNIINDYGNQFNFYPNLRLARHYDYPTKKTKTEALWIILKTNKKGGIHNLSKHLKENQFILFDFSSWKTPDEIDNDFMISDASSVEFKKSLWSMFIAIFITNKLLINNYFEAKEKEVIFKKMDFEIFRQMNIIKEAIHNISSSIQIKSSLNHAAEIFLSKINWKCIGSGANFNLSKYTSKRLIKELERACAFDVLENHKHIDISAESGILVFIANILKKGYQEDAFSELEKLIAHNNIPVIITNEGDDRFDNMSLNQPDFNNQKYDINVPVIKIPRVGIQYAFAINVFLIEMFINILKNKEDNNRNIGVYSNATQSPTKELINANIWK